MITDVNTASAATIAPWVSAGKGSKEPAELRFPRGSVARELFENPAKFDFFQAVLLLQQLASESDDCPASVISHFAQPSQESLRFTVPDSTAFPTATISSIQWDSDQCRASVEVNFMGLTGPSGMLPPSYNERLRQIELSSRHPERFSLRDWLDNFNHRLVSLFFGAWKKYRFPLAIGQSYLAKPQHRTEPTIIRVALASLAGLDQQVLDNDCVKKRRDASLESVSRPSIERDELLGLAGFLAQRPMNVSNLKAALEQCLGVQVNIVSFQGCWLELEPETQFHLGVNNNELGQNAILGERIWNRQQRVLIEVGPLSATEFQRFLPPSEEHVADGYCRLSDLVRICVGPTLQFDIRPTLRIDHPTNIELTSKSSKNRLGIDSWLGTPSNVNVATDAIFSGQ